jgi:hypothetical protein
MQLAAPWACEQRDERPWNGDHACGCSQPGMPGPSCNVSNGDKPRRLSAGFRWRPASSSNAPPPPVRLANSRTAIPEDDVNQVYASALIQCRGMTRPHCLTSLRLFLANARSPFTRKLTEVIVPSHPNLAFESLAILTSSGPGNRRTAGTTLRAAISSGARTRTVPSTFNAKTKFGTNSSSSCGCNSVAIPYPTPRSH